MPFTRIGARNTVPSKMARMVPLGLFHISFRLYSVILAALGVMVAHFTATPYFKVALQAPYFDGAKLLIAADCTAYAYANFHKEFIRGKVTLIGCPKLDAVNYSEKLTEILRNNDIQSVTIVRMEVPCCGGLEMAAKKAIQDSGKFLPWQVVTISIDGEIQE